MTSVVMWMKGFKEKKVGSKQISKEEAMHNPGENWAVSHGSIKRDDETYFAFGCFQSAL